MNTGKSLDLALGEMENVAGVLKVRGLLCILLFLNLKRRKKQLFVFNDAYIKINHSLRKNPKTKK